MRFIAAPLYSVLHVKSWFINVSLYLSMLVVTDICCLNSYFYNFTRLQIILKLCAEISRTIMFVCFHFFAFVFVIRKVCHLLIFINLLIVWLNFEEGLKCSYYTFILLCIIPLLFSWYLHFHMILLYFLCIFSFSVLLTAFVEMCFKNCVSRCIYSTRFRALKDADIAKRRYLRLNIYDTATYKKIRTWKYARYSGSRD